MESNLSLIHISRYRDVEPVLRSGQDRAPAGEASGDCGYVRGAGFYGEE